MIFNLMVNKWFVMVFFVKKNNIGNSLFVLKNVLWFFFKNEKIDFILMFLLRCNGICI